MKPNLKTSHKLAVFVPIATLLLAGCGTATRPAEPSGSNYKTPPLPTNSSDQPAPPSADSSYMAPSSTSTNPPPSASPTTEMKVTLQNFAFSPATLTVKAGTKVTWTNQDSAPHTVTGSNGMFESGSLSKGQSFSFTFDKPGTYSYSCSIHPNMKGTIVVQ